MLKLKRFPFFFQARSNLVKSSTSKQSDNVATVVLEKNKFLAPKITFCDEYVKVCLVNV